MSSENSQLHVVFGRSAAATLDQAFKVAGRKATVVAPYDDFSFGPIATDDAEIRAQWIENELGYSDWQEIFNKSLPVLTISMQSDDPPVAWISPDCARSVAGFLWWLSHMEGRKCLVLEVPELSVLNCDAISEYFDQELPLPETRRAHSLALWMKLQAENSALRVLGDNGLISVQIEHFDVALQGHVTSEWQKMARIVGNALGDFVETGVRQTGDIVLAARLAHLAKVGNLEWRGDLGCMASCEIRLNADGAIQIAS